MAVVYSTSALAVVDPYEVLQITPAEGDVTSLQHFTITFGDLPVVVNAEAVPTLQKGGGATDEGSMRADDEGKTVLIDFEKCYTASGHYYLNIPEGSITVNGQRLLPLTLKFNISGTMETFYEQITIDPAEGEVESLQNFTVSFPEYVGEIAYGNRAKLTNNTTGTAYRGEMFDVGYNVMVYFDDEITEPGEYTLTIPAGAVIVYTLGEDIHELSFHYTVVGGGEPSFYDKITIDPAEGKVDTLQDFTITFPEDVDRITDGSKAVLADTATGTTWQADMSADGNHVRVALDEEVTAPGDYRLTIPAGAVVVSSLEGPMEELNFDYSIREKQEAGFTINPPEGEVYMLQNFTIAYGTPVEVDEEALPVLVNDETGEPYECHLVEIGHNAFVYMEYPLSILGNYTLTVPANCIDILATGLTNPEYVFHYTIVEKEVYIPTVIEEQPEGDLRLYNRAGGVVREVEVSSDAPDGVNPYEIIYEEQDGAISIVFGPDNKVYIQHPVSWSYYNGWIEGTLSDDGKTITVPMGQYVAYARSLEMAVQVGVFVYDAEAGTYVYDASVEELTYTIGDDGTITMNGTDTSRILGTMNRAFGSQFQYLDYEWLQSGDYQSVYVPAAEQPLTPPEDLATESFYLTTVVNDGMEWDPFSAIVTMGFDGDDVWMKGISEYLPEAWIKGKREDRTITFPNSQLLGAYEVMVYFKAADYNPVNGNTTQQDMVLTINEDGTFSTFDYVFITTDKNNLDYINYYQGLTISRYPDVVVMAPEDLELKDYIFTFKTSATAPPTTGQTRVKVGFYEDLVFIKGLWEYMPDAWIAGRLVDGQLVLSLAQYMGNFKVEYSPVYPIFLTAFDLNTGLLQPQVTFNYDADTRSFSNPSYPLSININKTGYLSLQDFHDCAFIPENSGISSVVADDARVIGYYDLQGHRLETAPDSGGIYIIKYSDGTSVKILKK